MDYKLVEITWTDSHTIGEGWQDLSDIPEDVIKIKTLGYLTKETKNFYQVVQTLSEDTTQVINGIVIPKGCVLKVRKLK